MPESSAAVESGAFVTGIRLDFLSRSATASMDTASAAAAEVDIMDAGPSHAATQGAASSAVSSDALPIPTSIPTSFAPAARPMDITIFPDLQRFAQQAQKADHKYTEDILEEIDGRGTKMPMASSMARPTTADHSLLENISNKGWAVYVVNLWIYLLILD